MGVRNLSDSLCLGCGSSSDRSSVLDDCRNSEHLQCVTVFRLAQHQHLGIAAIVEAGFEQLSAEVILPTCELKNCAFADGLFDLIRRDQCRTIRQRTFFAFQSRRIAVLKCWFVTCHPTTD